MSTYYVGSGITYLQYLQAKSFVSDVKGGQQKATKAINLSVAKQTLEIIASQEALARENIRAIDGGFGKVAQATQEGFEQLTWAIQDVNRGISEINATFQWGFGEMLNQMTRLNSAVSELVKLATTPVQTEANEYFQNARDALRRGLYPEALEEAEKAISKHKLEWRYYSLAGTIHLGSVSGDLALLDLQKAEEYFLSAARYAKTDAPEDAARSYMAASWAAYCQGKMGRALSHAEQAIALHAALAEALFQAGKIYMALSEPDNALPLLGRAIELDKCYALKAAADGDFQQYETELREFLESFRQEKICQIGPEIETTLKKYEFWLSRSEDMRHDPLVQKAISFVRDGLPLWDLLNAEKELAALPGKLAERSIGLRFFDRIEEPGSEYYIEEKYLEPAPAGAGFFRKLAGPTERVRTVTKSWRKERILIRDSTGMICDQIELVPIPPASFLMRHQVDSGLAYVHSVNITRAFLLSVTPVTVAQYEGLTLQSKPSSKNAAFPMVNVTWYDAVAYCNALSREAALEEAYEISNSGVKFKGIECGGYRLPTEAEWERACWKDPADSGAIRSSSEIGQLAWVAENSGHALQCVALKEANVWGLYDMLGNVSEWVFDWYVDRAWPWPEADPIGPDEHQIVREPRYSDDADSSVKAKGKVTRGGSYADPSEYVKRGGITRPVDPKIKSPTVGFRLARTAVPR